MEEVWKDIPGYEGFYQVSDLGRVKSLGRLDTIGRSVKEKFLKQPNLRGYSYLKLNKNGCGKVFQVHQIVAMAFLQHERCGHKLVINHINFIKTDNRLENLEVVSQRDNGNKKHLKSSSKYTGVCWDKQRSKWMASIYINGKLKYLGRFNNEYDANLAYQKELTELNK